MKKYFIGHFIYNQNGHKLYKYELCNPRDFDFYYSKMLNYTVKRNKTLHKDIMTDADRKYCRGRVFEFKGLGPVIVVGNWIKQYPEAVELIQTTFQLPKYPGLIVHKHWDVENNKEFK